MPSADLYLSKVDLTKYLKRSDCGQCGILSCSEFSIALTKRAKKPEECPFLSRKEILAFQNVLNLMEQKIEIPALTHPRSGYVGLVAINNPDERSLVLLSGNNQYTEDIILQVLSTGTQPFHLIFIDTDGNTVDMAMVYGTLTAERICEALKETEIDKKVRIRELIIPGLAIPVKEEVEKISGWKVKIGPVCVFELPLFNSI